MKRMLHLADTFQGKRWVWYCKVHTIHAKGEVCHARWEGLMGLRYGATCKRCGKRFRLHDKWHAAEDISGSAICHLCFTGRAK